MSDFDCPFCGHTLKGQSNLFGKICMYCYNYIEPSVELPIVRLNKEKTAIMLEKARDSIKRNENRRKTMSISKEKVNVDFEYNDVEKHIHMSVRLHHTEEYGSTISFSTNGKDFTGLPAGFFSETIDFLRGNGYIDGDSNSPQPRSSNKEDKPLLPIPNTTPISSTMSIPRPGTTRMKEQAEMSESDEISSVNDRPVENFGVLSPAVSAVIKNAQEAEVELKSESEPEPEPEEIDAQAILEERKQAKQRAAANENKPSVNRTG